MDNSTTFQGDGEVAYIPVVVNGKQVRQTNGDRIRNMSDEELAENLMKSYDCPKGKDCVEQMPGEDGFQQCKRCWVEWLRQECE